MPSPKDWESRRDMDSSRGMSLFGSTSSILALLARKARSGRWLAPGRPPQPAPASVLQGDRQPVGMSARIARGLSRFRSIAKEKGVATASVRAARKVRRKLDPHGIIPFRWVTGPLKRVYPPYRAWSATDEVRLDFDQCRYYEPLPQCDPYDAWLAVNRENPRRRRRIDAALSQAHANCRASHPPRFSVLVPTYDPPVELFDAMIQSVVAQSFADWELILVDNGSKNPAIPSLINDWARRDSRIKPLHRAVNANISAATNQAADAARADFLILADSDDLLDPDALAHVALFLDRSPDTDLIYSDEDVVGALDERSSPRFKPDWSPELLLSFCYPGHLTTIRRSLYHQVGGMRSAFDGSQDHDFWLRASERTDRVGHIPQILYHWRILPGASATHYKPATLEAGRRAVEEAFHRRGLDCPVRQTPWAAADGCAIFEPVMPDHGPAVAILIPSRNHGRRLKTAIDSLAKTTYQNFRIYVIDNASDDPATLHYLASLNHRVLWIPNQNDKFSYAAINNAAVSMIDEELILFLNDDIEVINPRWLSQMVGWSRLAGVGAVGARLFFPDGRIQHAGIVHGFNEGLGGHAFRFLPWWHGGTFNQARVSRNCLGVTAACMLTPRQLFLDLGGFDESRFPVAYNDADYGMRVVDAGYRCVYCAEAELYHHEGLSRGKASDPRELAAYRQSHGHRTDPFFNPHLDPENETFETMPTVVPVANPRGPVPMLAATHNLNWEGAPRFELELLCRLKAAGTVAPVVLSPCDGPIRAQFEQAGIEVRIDPTLIGLASRSSLYHETIARLAASIQDGPYELIHANTLQTFWAVEAARAARIPSVWSVHESEPWTTYFDDLPAEVAASALNCLTYPYRVVFTAHSSARVWAPLNSARNFSLIRFAFDTQQFADSLKEIDRPLARRQLDLADDDLAVLLLGTVCQRKGQQDLLRAFATLPAKVAARIKCIVVGGRDSVPYSRELQAMAQRLQSDRRDRFVIIPETGDTAAFWRAADVFCCTSRVESYPRVILEAMAAGLPIITTPVFGIAEQVRDNVNALMYLPGDVGTLRTHLFNLARDPRQRASLAAASPLVLKSLPGHAELDAQYARTFVAAAESAAPGIVDRQDLPQQRQQAAPSSRTWFIDKARAAIVSQHSRHSASTRNRSFVHNDRP